jgi:hypothetical protein
VKPWERKARNITLYFKVLYYQNIFDHMETAIETLNPEQELAYIRKIINDSRTSAAEDGIPYIVWGVIVALGMLANYFEVQYQVDLKAGYIWIALILAGWGSTFWYVRRNKRDPRPKSFADKLQGAIWGACGSTIGMIVLVFAVHITALPGSGINPMYTCSIASFILGIAYYLSGYALEILWLRYIGYAWWLGAIVQYYFVGIHIFLMYAAMLLLFQVIPGIILNRTYRRTIDALAS